MGSAIIISPVFLCAIIWNRYPHVIETEYSLEFEAAIHLFAGLIFIVFGLLVPHSKYGSNHGIPTVWNLNNPENWYSTQKFASFLWIFVGTIILLTMFIQQDDLVFILSFVLCISLLIPIFYSYLLNKYQRVRGTAFDDDDFDTPEERIITRYIIIFGACLLILIIYRVSSGKLYYDLSDSCFTVSGSSFKGITIEYSEMDSINLCEDGVPGRRVYGYGGVLAQMGNFYNADFEFHNRYTYNKCQCCIVITYDNTHLVINENTPEKTKKLYIKLKAHLT